MHLPDKVLSGVHLTSQATDMQVHPDMFAVCTPGLQKTRRFQGILSHRQEDSPLSSMGRTWIRPGTMTKQRFF